MNVSEELSHMIEEMQSRTGGEPGQIFCSQETLQQLWEQTRMIYVSNDDVESGRGYAARYMGIPISISPDMEPGKVCLIPNRGIQPQFGIDFSNVSDASVDRVDGWWPRSPFTTPGGWQVRADPFINPAYQVAFNLDETQKKKKPPAKKTATTDEPTDIDEDSFIDILKGGSGHDDAGSI